MKNLKKIFIMIFFLNIYLFADTQVDIKKDILLVGNKQNQEFVLKSKFNKQEYLVQIYVPKNKAPETGYDVVYALDGNATFPYASVMAQAVDNMSYRTKKVPPLIVGIGYNTDNLFNVEARAFDYTPPYKGELKVPENRKNNQYSQGGADKFYKFLQNELKPIIEDNYSINKSKQTLFGHSYGGLFTLYAFINHNEDFQNFVAASPSIWWNDFYILKEIKNKKIEIKYPTKLYLSVGEIENKSKNPSDIETFAKNIKDQNNLEIKILNISSATHLEALFPAFNQVFKIYK